ncbi:MAG: lysophospholipid acyltransferase family protein [Nitrospiria bacterium]
MSDRPGFFIKCWYGIGLVFWNIIFKKLNQVEIFGFENRPRREEGSVLLLSNHISSIDPFLIAVTSYTFFSPIRWRAPAKEELFRYPVVRNIISTWGAFPVRRGKGDYEAMNQMVEMLKESVVVIFPEGTRSRDGLLLKGRPGVGKIIWEARPSKIIPVVVEGTNWILPIGKIFPSYGKKTRIYYGSPMDFSSFYPEKPTIEFTQHMVDLVIERLDLMQKEMNFKF